MTLNLIYHTVFEYIWDAPAGHSDADVIAAYDHLVATTSGEVPLDVSGDSVHARGALRYRAVHGEGITWDNDVVDLRSIKRYAGGKYAMALLVRCAAWLEGTFTTYEGEEMALDGPTLRFIRETDGDLASDDLEMFEAAQTSTAAHLNAAAASAMRAVSGVPQGGRLVPRKMVDLAVIQLPRDAPERLVAKIGMAISTLIALLANMDPDTDFTTLREGMGPFTDDVLPAGQSMNLWKTTTGFVDRSTAELYKVAKTLADHAGDVNDTIKRGLRGVSANRRNEIIQRGVRAVASAPTANAQINAYERQVALLHPQGLMEEFEEALADEITTAGVQAILAALQARHDHNPPGRTTRFPASRIQTPAPHGIRGRSKRRGKTKGKKLSKSARSRRRRRSRSGRGGKGKGGGK